MFRPIARRLLDRFSERYDYDVSYLLDMLEHDRRVFWKFGKLMGLAQYRRTTPSEAFFVAKLVAAIHEDCGACTQLVADLAREAGVSAEDIRAALAADYSMMSPDARLACEFAKGVCSDVESLDGARRRVHDRWGEQGVIELSIAVATSRVFPVVKRGMGHAKQCRVSLVGGSEVPVLGVAG